MVKSAAGYESAFAKTSTLLNENEIDLKKYKQDILKTSSEIGVSANETSEAVYQALSASVAPEKAVEFTKVANKLSKGGFTKLSTSVDVLTSALNAYGLEANQASRISDILITTQNLGKTTVDELAAKMGRVIPTAAAYGVSMENIGASYALLTKRGINTANATTQIRSLLTSLTKEGGKTLQAGDYIREATGKSFKELSESGKSLSDVLNILMKSAGNNTDEFSKMFGNVNAKAAALALMQGGTEEYNEALKQMTNSEGAADKAAGKMADTFEAKLNKIKNNFKNIVISIGDKLLPIVESGATKILDAMPEINGWIEKIIPVFSRLFDSMLPPLSQLAKTLFPALLTLTSTLMPVFSDVVNTVMPVFIELIQSLLPPLISIIQTLLPPLVEIIKSLLPLFQTTFELLKPILDLVTQLLTPLATLISTAIAPLVSNFATLLNDLLKPIIPIISELATLLSETLAPVFEALSPIFTAISEALSPIFEIFTQLLQVVLPAIMPLIKEVAKLLGGVLGTAIKSISGAIQGVANILGGLIDFITGIFTGNWEKAWNGIKSIFKGVWDTFYNIVKLPINLIIKGINFLWSGIYKAVKGIVDSIGSIAGAIGDVFGQDWHFSMPDEPPLIPELEEGGVLEKGQVGLLEGNGDEAVVPLSKNTGWIDKVAAKISSGIQPPSEPSHFTNDEKEESDAVVVNNYNTFNLNGIDINNDDDIWTLARKLSLILAQITLNRKGAFT